MADLQVKVQSIEEAAAMVVQAMHDAADGCKRKAQHVASFPSYEMMHAMLSPSRLAILQAMAGQGALTMHEVARRLGRDPQAVYRDLSRLIAAGIVMRDGDGVLFPYDGLRMNYSMRAHTA